MSEVHVLAILLNSTEIKGSDHKHLFLLLLRCVRGTLSLVVYKFCFFFLSEGTNSNKLAKEFRFGLVDSISI